MSKRNISDELVAEFLRLRQEGKSYRTIGKLLKVDPRTVKGRVEKAGEGKEREHWEAVSRQVDAKYLDEHYRLLIGIIASVRDTLRVNPVDFDFKRDAESLIGEAIQLGLQQSSNLLKERGLSISESLSRHLLESLMEHEPRLKVTLDEWKGHWNRFQKECGELADQACGLFIQEKLRPEAAEPLGIAVAGEGMRIKLLGEDTRSSKVEHINDKRSRLIRSNRQISEEVHKGPKQEVEAAKNAYELVLSQVTLEQRIAPVKLAYNKLTASARNVVDSIERLVLIGRPQGRCSLCPGRLD
jgi:hypothetical protein